MNSEPIEKTVAELAAHVGGRAYGDEAVRIRRVAHLQEAETGDLAFVAERKLFDAARASRASCLIVPEGAGPEISVRSVIEAARPKLAFALAAELLHPQEKHAPAIHPTAVIEETACLGAGVFIGPFVEIGARAILGAGVQLHAGVRVGADVEVGADCVLRPNVVLYDGVHLGARVILHAGVVIGADGFGYVPDEQNVRHKFPQIGTVIIEDDVEIGALTCVDRGALGATRIGRAAKIDNLVQVGHNVQIGARVVIAAQTGISGSTVIEEDAIIGGQVGFGDHARVQAGAIIGSKAGVLPGKIVRPGVWWGVPVIPLEEYKIRNAHLARLPQLREEVKELRRQLQELQARLEKK